MKKRILSILLSFALVCGVFPLAKANVASVNNSPAIIFQAEAHEFWARSGITSAISRGFVPERIQNNYQNVITREEFSTMAVRWVEYTLGRSADAILTERSLSRFPNPFTDTVNNDVLAAYALGITSGIGEGRFDPQGNFTRQQAATMIMNTLRVIDPNIQVPVASTFADINTASEWARPGISFVQANGIMSGTGDNNFSPHRTFTRQESIVTFDNIDVPPIQIERDFDGLLNPARLHRAASATFPPFCFINEDGEFDGFSARIAKAIADILGVELYTEDMEFAAALTAVEAGLADIAATAITITESRLETMDFTIPYFETTIVAIVPKDSDITTLEELDQEGNAVAVQASTTSNIYAINNLPNVNVIPLDSTPMTILELRSGRVDAIIADGAVAQRIIADNPDFRIFDEPLTREAYGIAVAKGNTALLDALNAALLQLKESGEHDRIYNLFFGD